MKALLLVAHGSRRAQSNDEVHVLAKKLRQFCSEQYPIIEAAFLELADPLIPDGIQKCVEQGACEVKVLPYFLNSGRHVVEDIPGIVEVARPDYPDVCIHVTPHLGGSELMMQLLVEVD